MSMIVVQHRGIEAELARQRKDDEVRDLACRARRTQHPARLDEHRSQAACLARAFAQRFEQVDRRERSGDPSQRHTISTAMGAKNSRSRLARSSAESRRSWSAAIARSA